MATDRPLPPFLPESLAQYEEHASLNPEAWYQYFQAAYQFIDQRDTGQDELANELVREKIRASEARENIEVAHSEITKLRTVLEFQETQFTKEKRELREEIVQTRIEKEKAVLLAQPTVQTPTITLPAERRAEAAADPAPRAPSPAPTAPSETTRQSEKLPDPEKFNGERKDLRRFVSQVHEKMFINRDRFPTPQSRMSYVSSRLTGTPYAQVLPHIKNGVCQLEDYQQVLQILDNAYGDPNRINNARSDLFRYRQTNKDFAAFFAEFQRLGLEAEMTEESLATLLEQAVSAEIKQMLVHSPPPSRRYLLLATHLQDLENRRRYYNQPAPPTNPKATPVAAPPRKDSYSAIVKESATGEPMDLSVSRKYARPDKETGACFRCHKTGHRVRDCPLPDQRPQLVKERDETARRLRSLEIQLDRPHSPTPPSDIRSSSPMRSENGRARSPKLRTTVSTEACSAEVYSLLDTGCEGYAFMDAAWAKSHNLPILPLRQPFKLYGFADEDDEAWTIRHYTRCNLKTGDHIEKGVPLFLTRLAHYPIVLGMPWLEKHDPTTNWSGSTITFTSEYCREHCNMPQNPSKIRLQTRNVPVEPAAADRRAALRRICIEEVSMNACRKYARRGYNLFVATIEDIDRVLSAEEEATLQEQLPKPLHDFADVFSPQLADKLPPHRPYDHDIKLVPGKDLPFGPLYGMSRDELTALREWLSENLRKGFIRPSSSPVASPVLFVRKPGGGLRLCIDFRAVNNVTVKDRYPLPLTTETLNNLKGMRYFTKIDIISAFNNVRMKEGQEYLTAFRTRFGLFESLVMPFGLTGAPATFQRFINDTLREYLDLFCSAYLDDILIYSRTEDEHLTHVRSVLKKLRNAGLYAKISKCEFFVPETKFLGMIVGQDGIRMDPEKIKTVQDWNSPACVTDVQAFVGFSNFYRRFIRDFSKIVAPLVNLTRKDTAFHW
ncbi:hypothetical protein KC316_g16709, partial [Hortaea werneckii]